MSSPRLALGQLNGSGTTASLAMASSCSCGQRLMWPLTNPFVTAMSDSPEFEKSAILLSQLQPDHAVLVAPLSSRKGASPLFSWSRRSFWFFAVLTYWKFDSTMPQPSVRFETNASQRPSWLKSPKSTPMPLNESLPIRLDFGVPGVLSVVTLVNFTWPGVDSLYSIRSGPKSFARYSSGNWSPSRSLREDASVQPCRAFSGSTSSGACLYLTVGLSPAVMPAHSRMCFPPPFSACDSEWFIVTPPFLVGSRMGLSG